MTSISDHARSEEIRHLVRLLNDELGIALVATMARVRDRRVPEAWARPEGPLPDQTSERQLRAVYSIWLLLAESGDRKRARDWFLAANRHLDGDAPYVAVNASRLDDVIAAAIARAERPRPPRRRRR